MITVRKIGSFGFEDGIKIIPAVKEKTAREVANRATNFFKSNFDRQGFLDRSVKKWKRSARAERTGNLTLKDTGDLRNTIAPIKVSWKRSVIQARQDYGIFHNEGRSPQPLRKFMGNSAVLLKLSNKIIQKNFRKTI